MINVVFFASLRERLDVNHVGLEYQQQQSVGDVITTLHQSDSRYELLLEQDVLCAVNHTLCSKEEAVKDGDEVAFFPPVTGG
jgi:molybdopterin synthase sulfur carrier subunit